MSFALNLGCGEKTYKQIGGLPCVNIDSRNIKGAIDIDLFNLPFDNNSVSYILASDIIEHFTKPDLKKLLKEWSRVLKKGGIIKVRTPNLNWICEEYSKTKDAEFISYHIFGGQDYETNFHYIILDRKWLKTMLQNVDIKEIEYIEEGSNFITKGEKI